MNSVKLSKSKYCKSIQCNKILWLDKFKPEERAELALESRFETGHEVGELAKGLFGEYSDVEFSQNLNEMLQKTKEYLEAGSSVITEASFAYDNNFCSVDILKNNEGKLDIYEVKSSTEIKDIYIEDISYQVYVLKKLGYEVQSANLIYLNNKYIRKGELDLNRLFKIEDVTEIVEHKQDEVHKKIIEINKYMQNEEEPTKDIGIHCQKPYGCAYWKYCSKHLPEKSVFNLRRLKSQKKFEMYYSGKYTFEDLINEKLNERILEQIDFEVNDKPTKIEKDEIKYFLDELYYPLYFLDFETYQPAIPEYDGIRPYMQVPFQYSLHYIEKEGDELKHKEFLAKEGTDPRRALAERLVQDIPTNSCVIAYNMSFEKTRIRELAAIYKDLSSHLMDIHNNIKDLMIPFQKRNFYSKELAGSYSIKQVLPTLFPNDEELDYHSLPLIHNGGEAMDAFPKMQNMSKEEIAEIRYGLLEYCKLDTLAMVKIWQKLKEICDL
ncbi:MAG: DUF2779 domain-containing protein [Lachnospiraceae bacterium]|nr:DUF2779 domain-containing protein [Lachnospiraceae bacterium]